MTQEPRSSGSDPISDLITGAQRWLVRTSARSMSREVGGQIRNVIGGSSPNRDVWERATSPQAEEPPECQGCPICAARRRLRDSQPGLASTVAAAADAVTVVMQDTVSAVEAALASRRAGPAPAADRPSAGTKVWIESVSAAPAAPVTPAAPVAESDSGVWETATSEPAVPGPPSRPAVPELRVAPDVPEQPAVGDGGVADEPDDRG